MSQSKMQSFLEAVTNVIIGYGVALATQIVVFPWFGMTVDLHDNLAIGAIFTVVSLARSYCIRRLWNFVHIRQVRRIVKEWEHR